MPLRTVGLTLAVGRGIAPARALRLHAPRPQPRGVPAVTAPARHGPRTPRPPRESMIAQKIAFQRGNTQLEIPQRAARTRLIPEYGPATEPIPHPVTQTAASSVGSGEPGKATATSVVTDTSGCTPAIAAATMAASATVPGAGGERKGRNHRRIRGHQRGEPSSEDPRGEKERELAAHAGQIGQRESRHRADRAGHPGARRENRRGEHRREQRDQQQHRHRRPCPVQDRHGAHERERQPQALHAKRIALERRDRLALLETTDDDNGEESNARERNPPPPQARRSAPRAPVPAPGRLRR